MSLAKKMITNPNLNPSQYAKTLKEKTQLIASYVLTGAIKDKRRDNLAALIGTSLETAIQDKKIEDRKNTVARYKAALDTPHVKELKVRQADIESAVQPINIQIADLQKRIDENSATLRAGPQGIVEPDYSYDGGGLSESTVANNVRIEREWRETTSPSLESANRKLREEISRLEQSTAKKEQSQLAKIAEMEKFVEMNDVI